MKRAPRISISLLLLVTMLLNMFPAFSLITTSYAADGGFSYKPATTVTPGKEYLVLNSAAAGTAYAMSPADNASTNNVTTSTSVAVTVNSDGTVSGSDATAALEWEFIQSVPANDRSNLLFMLQHKETGAYLWNPAYEIDSTNLGTCITPLQDSYNGGTIAVFDYNPATATDAASSENILLGYSGSAEFQGPWFRHQSPATGDGNFTVNFNRTGLDCSTWRYMSFTYHDGSADNANLKWPAGSKIGVFSNTSDFGGPNPSYYYNGVTIAAGWNSPTFDLYESISGNGFRGTLYSIRIDPVDNANDANLHGYVDSLIMGKTVAGIQTVAAYRKEVADRRGGGLMPSVEYPFCQFGISSLGNGAFALSFYGTTTNNLSNYQYLTAPASSGSAFSLGSSQAGVYLFEKVYDANSSVTWVLADEFETGEDYAFASVNDGVGVIYNNDGTTVSATVSASNIISEVPDSATWSAYSNSIINGSCSVNGQEGFWLSNNISRCFMIASNGAVNTSYAFSSITGAYYYPNFCNYIWNYENGKLISASPNKAQTVGASNDVCTTVSFDSGSLTGSENGAVYIYKKVYHEHDYTELSRIDATCTTAGEVTYTCSCGVTKTEVLEALGHVEGAVSSIDATYHGYTCSRCSQQIKTTHSIVYDNTGSDTEHTVKCAVCNYSVTQPHVLTVVSTEPDCTHPTITTTSCSLCGYEKVEQGSDLAGHKQNAGFITTPAGCTTDGTLSFTCLVCGSSAGTASITAHGHMYSDWYTVNNSTRAKKCLHCGDVITESYDSYSADYVYGRVDTPVSGRDYIIASTSYAGSGYAAGSAAFSDENEDWIVSTPITVNAADSLCSVPYIKADSVGSNIKWTAEANGSKFAFKNIETGEYLWAKDLTDSTSVEWIHNNIGSENTSSDHLFSAYAASVSNPAGGVINSGVGTQLLADSQMQVGFRNSIYSNGYTIPGKNALRFESDSFYYPIIGFVDENGNSIDINSDAFPEIDGDSVIDLDFSFSSPDCCLILYKPDYSNGLYGQRIEILGGAAGTAENEGTCITFVTNTQTSSGINSDVYVGGINLNNSKFDGTAVDNGLTTGENVWHHLRIICDGDSNSTDVYIDNVHIIRQEGWIFDQPVLNNDEGIYSNKYSHKGIHMLTWISKTGSVHQNSGIPMRHITYGSTSTEDWAVWVDNLNVVTDEVHIYDDYDNNRNAFYSTANITADFVNFTNPTVVEPERIAENVFVANKDNSNKVYLYEKQYKYTVEYYYDGVIDSTLTETGYRSPGAVVSYTDRSKLGYVFSGATPAGTITVSENTASNVIKVYYVSVGAANDDAFAVSFAKTAIPASYFSDNDTVSASVTSYTLSGISSTISGSVNTVYSSSKMTSGTVTADNVTVTLENGSIIVNSTDTTDINVSFYLQFTFVQNEITGYIYSKANIISANSVYFEDNSGLITYTDGTLQNGEAYSWQTVGSGSIPAAVYDDIYGYSDTYNSASYIQYSAGSSYMLTLTEEADYNGGEAYATFQFTGTGFDIISHADSTSGIIFVDVYSLENGVRSDDTVYSYFVNNYLGYTYEDGKWVASDSAEAIYQIPTIKVMGLELGDYEVVITPTYAKDFKERFDGPTNFYLDAVRVYSPMADTEEVRSVYASASQYAPVYYDIGDLIVNSEGTDWSEGSNGIMYVTSKSGVTQAADYVQYGPNHEVYLESGNYITFYLTASSIPDLAVIGASAIGGSATMTVAYGTSYADTALNSGVDMYYPLITAEWELNSETGLYKTREAITVTAKSGTVSLTDIRFSSAELSTLTVGFEVSSTAEMISVVDKVIDVLSTMLGDVNGDDLVNALDSIVTKKYMAGTISLTEEQLKALDINGDGKINAKDVIALKKLISGQ